MENSNSDKGAKSVVCSNKSANKKNCAILKEPIPEESETPKSSIESCDTNIKHVFIKHTDSQTVINGESDKENVDDSPRRKPVINGSNVLSTPSDNFRSPSPNMRAFQRTPLRRHTMDEKVFSTPECYKYVHFDKPYYDFGFSDRSDDGEDSCSVTVAVRVRPFSARYNAFENDFRK